VVSGLSILSVSCAIGKLHLSHMLRILTGTSLVLDETNRLSMCTLQVTASSAQASIRG
jgi:hypothetical protein